MVRRKAPRTTEYDTHAQHFADRYESISPEECNRWLLGFLPQQPACVLDIGAGSGRDAAWLAGQGFRTRAVEPSSAMREQALSRHPTDSFDLLAGKLPGLGCSGEKFDFILISGVWNFVLPKSRNAAFSELADLLARDGCIALTMRKPPDKSRGMHFCKITTMAMLAKANGLHIAYNQVHPDFLGRQNVKWRCLILRHISKQTT